MRLTTRPTGYWAGGSENHFIVNGMQFTRLKCQTCGGTKKGDRRKTWPSHLVVYDDCSACRGTGFTRNTWECEEWPVVVFEMPT